MVEFELLIWFLQKPAQQSFSVQGKDSNSMDNTANKEMQFSTLVATGTRKGQKPVVLSRGFKYSFLDCCNPKELQTKAMK